MTLNLLKGVIPRPAMLGNKYINYIEDVRDYRNKNVPEISIIIVTYNRIKYLKECLDSINAQTINTYEVIIINNGKLDVPKEYYIGSNSVYIKLKHNYGLNVGRNVGIITSKSDILAFLDDDCIVDRQYIANTLTLMMDKKYIGFRGRIRFKTDSIYNYMQSHYDLGEYIIPYYINTEGNSVIRKSAICDVGGWEDSIIGYGGHEGTILSKKLVEKFGYDGLIYYPDAIIYHDYSDSVIKIIKKDIRHKYYEEIIQREHNSILEYTKRYQIYNKINYNIDNSKMYRVRIISIIRNIIKDSILIRKYIDIKIKGKKTNIMCTNN